MISCRAWLKPKSGRRDSSSSRRKVDRRYELPTRTGTGFKATIVPAIQSHHAKTTASVVRRPVSGKAQAARRSIQARARHARPKAPRCRARGAFEGQATGDARQHPPTGPIPSTAVLHRRAISNLRSAGGERFAANPDGRVDQKIGMPMRIVQKHRWPAPNVGLGCVGGLRPGVSDAEWLGDFQPRTAASPARRGPRHGEAPSSRRMRSSCSIFTGLTRW